MLAAMEMGGAIARLEVAARDHERVLIEVTSELLGTGKSALDDPRVRLAKAQYDAQNAAMWRAISAAHLEYARDVAGVR